MVLSEKGGSMKKMSTENRFVNFILTLVTFELILTLVQFSNPGKLKGLLLFGRYEISQNILSAFTVLINSGLAFAYCDAYWLSSVAAVSLAIVVKHVKIMWASYIAEALDIHESDVLFYLGVLDITLYLTAIVLLFKFKKNDSHPKLFGILMRGNKDVGQKKN